MKRILLAFFAAILFLNPSLAFAQDKASQSSANIVSNHETKAVFDWRAKTLKAYLQSRNSPLSENANDFVYYADKYNLDWKLVAAISGVESTFGQAIPPYSYNGWGWGVYGDNVIRFGSWKEGIATISAGLRERYMDSWGAKNIYEVGSKYAASPVWASHVEIYLNQIQKFALSDTKNSLPLSF